MRQLTRLMVVTVLLFCCVGCDQITKGLARAYLSPGVSESYAHDTVRIIYSENAGAFLSLGDSLPKSARIGLLQWGVSLLVLGLIGAALFWRNLGMSQVVAVTLLGASGLGNLIDRLVYDGHVTDFLNMGVGYLRTGIFNVADVIGVVGVVMLLLSKSRPTPSNNRMQRTRER